MKSGAEKQVVGAVWAVGRMPHQGSMGLDWLCMFMPRALAVCKLQEQNWSVTNVTPGNMHFWHGGLIASVCVLSSEVFTSGTLKDCSETNQKAGKCLRIEVVGVPSFKLAKKKFKILVVDGKYLLQD